MSYRNPKQVVDTQSGQHVRNMLQQISGATVGALNQIKKEADKKREENLADRKAQADRLFTAETELNQIALANPGLDVSKAIEGNLKKMATLLKEYGNEPYKWPSEVKTFMANVKTMGTAIRMQGASNSALAQQISEVKEKPLGTMGGGDLYADPEVYKKFDIQFRSGRTAGSSEIDFDMTKPGGPIPYTIMRDSSGKEIGRSLNTDFDIADYPVIPNATKEIQASGKKFKKDPIIRNPMASLFDDMEVIELEKDPEGNIQYGKKINPERLAQYARKNLDTDSYIDSLTPNEAAKFFNNIIKDYVSEEDFSVAGGMGFKINFIDPKVATWNTDKEGRVNDPRREMIKNAYARFVVEKEGLAEEVINFGKVKPKTNNTFRTTPLKERIVKTKKSLASLNKWSKEKGANGNKKMPVFTLYSIKNNNERIVAKNANKGVKGAKEDWKWVLERKTGGVFKATDVIRDDYKDLLTNLGFENPLLK